MLGITNVGGTAKGLNSKDAVIHIKSATGSTINFFDNENNLLKSLSPSMGIVDNTNLGMASYYCTISNKNFGTIIIRLTYDGTNIYKLEANINSNKFYSYNSSDFTLEMPTILKLFENGQFSDIIQGMTMLKGTSSSQSDTLTISDIGFEYCEWNNDYGGIVTQNAIPFLGYDILRINIENISGWQDSNFKASVYLSTSKPTSVSSSGITAYNYQEQINPTGNSDVHIKNYSKEIVIPLNYYQGTYYIILTTASGASVNITPGYIYINTIQLEKNAN